MLQTPGPEKFVQTGLPADALSGDEEGRADAVARIRKLAVLGYEKFVRIEPLRSGLSSDEKYRIETAEGETLLLRIADAEERTRKRAEYGMIERAWAAGIPVPRPVAFGACDGGNRVCSLSGWLPGVDVKTALAALPADGRFRLGEGCGQLLRRLHALSAPADADPWGARFRLKVAQRVRFYCEHPIRSAGADAVVRHLTDHEFLLDGRPQTFNHGDFNPENVILSPEGVLGAIDFNAYNLGYGDPWWELGCVIPGEEADAPYLTGLIDGYFGAPPPPGFFPMLRYYAAYSALAALCDTSVWDGGAPEDGRRHLDNTLRWFDGFRTEIPSWYRGMGGQA